MTEVTANALDAIDAAATENGHSETNGAPEVESNNNEESESVYVVEDILDKRTDKNTVEYFVKWQNYPSNANTWEPVDNLRQHCALLVDSFEAEMKRRECTQAASSPATSRRSARKSMPSAAASNDGASAEPAAKKTKPTEAPPVSDPPAAAEAEVPALPLHAIDEPMAKPKETQAQINLPATATDTSTEEELFNASKCLWQDNICTVCQSKHFSEQSWRTHISNKQHQHRLAIYEFLSDFSVFEPAPNGTKSAVVALLKQSHCPLMGTEYIHEFHDTSGYKFWACSLCYAAASSQQKMIAHLSSNLHRIIFVVRHRPTVPM